MSIRNFYEFESHSGDKYQFQITDDNLMYLIHINKEGIVENRFDLNENLDESRITKGFFKIAETMASLPARAYHVTEALSGLLKSANK
jgi:hypothetical protein